jgi:hypothetical protein
MSGGYTHVTMAQFCIEDAMHHRADLLHRDARQALGLFKKYCIVGAVAPDYPYLHVMHGASAAWADAMHKGGAVDMLRAGVAQARAIADDNVRRKCLAWLFGVASHMVTDGVVHPVVNLKVGVYELNKTAHRRCEMSQDVYIHRRLNLGAVEYNQQISANIDGASDPADRDRLDPDIAALWREMLTQTYRGRPEPEIDGWHRGMRAMVRLGSSGNYLFPFARHVAANQGLVYPETPEREYIEDLRVPGDKALHFDALFDKAKAHVLEMWGWLALSLQNQASRLDALKNWSLDDGIDEDGIMIFWS